MTAPLVPAAGSIVATLGKAGLGLKVVGASTAAASASTLLLAAGGAAAMVLVGMGVYRRLAK